MLISIVNKYLKDKRILIAGAVILVLIVVIVGFFLVFNKSSQTQNSQGVNAIPTQIPIPTITADSIGLTLKAGAAGKTVIASITNANGISAIDYELSYTSQGNIPRGAIGQFDLTKKPVSKEITLGTCSDVCHYDQGVSNIKIVLKVTKTDGNAYQAQASLASIDQ